MEKNTAHRSTGALMEISKYSLEEYSKLEKEVGLSFGFKKKGLLMVGLGAEAIQAATVEMNLAAEFGIPGKYLNEAEVKDLEPALTGQLLGGVYFPEEAHCEPLAAVKAFMQGALAKGVRFFPKTEAFDFRTAGGKVLEVRTTRGWFEANQFVLATGSWSHSFGKRLKLDVPILGGKGYSLILEPFNPSPKIPIMIVDKKIGLPRAKAL
jgi:D-amino-acid dehydrogenase